MVASSADILTRSETAKTCLQESMRVSHEVYNHKINDPLEAMRGVASVQDYKKDEAGHPTEVIEQRPISDEEWDVYTAHLSGYFFDRVGETAQKEAVKGNVLRGNEVTDVVGDVEGLMANFSAHTVYRLEAAAAEVRLLHEREATLSEAEKGALKAVQAEVEKWSMIGDVHNAIQERRRLGAMQQVPTQEYPAVRVTSKEVMPAEGGPARAMYEVSLKTVTETVQTSIIPVLEKQMTEVGLSDEEQAIVISAAEHHTENATKQNAAVLANVFGREMPPKVAEILVVGKTPEELAGMTPEQKTAAFLNGCLIEQATWMHIADQFKALGMEYQDIRDRTTKTTEALQKLSAKV
jgi:hypothetical protein